MRQSQLHLVQVSGRDTHGSSIISFTRTVQQLFHVCPNAAIQFGRLVVVHERHLGQRILSFERDGQRLVGNGQQRRPTLLFENLFELFAQKCFERGTDGALLASRNGADRVGRVTERLKRNEFQTGCGLGGVGKELLRNLIGAEFGVLFGVTDLMMMVAWNELASIVRTIDKTQNNSLCAIIERNIFLLTLKREYPAEVSWSTNMISIAWIVKEPDDKGRSAGVYYVHRQSRTILTVMVEGAGVPSGFRKSSAGGSDGHGEQKLMRHQCIRTYNRYMVYVF